MPFSVAEAARAGIPSARLRRADLHAPYRGVRTAVKPLSGLDHVFAYAPNLREDQAFSHISAALLWGMWLPARLVSQPVVHVMALGGAQRPRAAGVQGYRGRSEPLALARGLPAVSPARVWVQLAPLLTLDELVAAGDGLVRRQSPLSTLPELAEAVRPGERGAELVHRALPLLRAGADSAKETDLRLVLARSGLPEPEVNGEVVMLSGDSTPGDLVFRPWKVLAEYDGQQHRVSRRQFERDVLRLEELARSGWTVVRVIDVHLDDPRSVVARVARALRDHGWRGRLSRGQYLRSL